MKCENAMKDLDELYDLEKDGSTSGNEKLIIHGDAYKCIIVIGNGNVVSPDCNQQLHYQILDDSFRQAQQDRAPADFYNGTRPNWANIFQKNDAHRNLYEDVRKFVEDLKPPQQRMGIITGPAGEGKTTLLMRLAWDLAEDGFVVFWRHFGKVSAASKVDYKSSRPIVFCFDQIGDEPQISKLIQDLCEFGIHFVILGTERQNEWHAANLESQVKGLLRFKIFQIPRLVESEVVSILDRLEKASKLDALTKYKKNKRIRHFLDRLQADGQLLPALITARTGEHNFNAIIHNMLERIGKQKNGDLLLYSYVLIASVHRWGRGLSSLLLADCTGIDESDIHHRILQYYDGEILALTLGENDRLYTRHPLIAEKAFQYAETRHLTPKAMDIYKRLFQAIGHYDLQDPAAQHSLLTFVPNAYRKTGDSLRARLLFQEATRMAPHYAKGWHAWGMLEKDLGNFTDARRLFQEATKAAPLEIPSWQAWALLERATVNIGEARRLFQEAPKDVGILQAWGVMERDLRNFDDARRLFKEATTLNPNHALSWQAWALVEKEDEHFSRARRLFRKAIEVNPEHAPSWQAWAIMEKELGNYDKAGSLFKAAPKDVQTWQAWGVMEKELGNFSQARRLFQKALALDSNHAPAWTAWGMLEEDQGNYEEAHRLFQKAIKADPHHVPAWQALVMLELGVGNEEEAHRLFQKAPKDGSFWHVWILNVQRHGHYREALRYYYEEATKEQPGYAPLWQSWGVTEKRAGNFDKARLLFQRATKEDPKHAPSWQAWAILEKELGNYEKARQLFGTAVKSDPKDRPSWQAWAIMEKELGNYKEARRLFEEAPKDVPTWQAWAIMEKEAGNFNRARELFQEATKGDPRHTAAWQAWAMMDLELGNLEEALEKAERALSFAAPDDFYPYIARGKVLQVCGQHQNSKADFEKARAILQERLKAQKNNGKLLNLLGEILIELKDYQSAKQILDRSLAIPLVHNKQFVHTVLGELYAAQACNKEAIKELERALEYCPSNLEAKRLLDKLKDK